MPHLLLVSANRFTNPYPVYPLGLSYLKSYLNREWPELTVTLLDMNQLNEAELQQRVAALAPDYVAVSLRNVDDVDLTQQRSFIDGYAQVVAAIRGGTRAPVILGGAGYSLFPERILKALGADYGIVGEGEQTLLQLLQGLERGGAVSGIGGLVIPEGQGCRLTPRQHHIDDPTLEFEPDLVAHYWRYSGMLNIQTKRGCPHRCVYCSYPIIDGRRVRTLKVEQIVSTLRQAWEQHGIDYVFFTDSVFNLEPQFNEALARALIKEGLPTRWGAYFAPHRLSRQQLALYQQAGLTHLEFGTEAMSDQTLASYGKPFRFKQVLKTAEVAADLGIHQAHFLILGGWGETRQTLSDTIANAERLPSTVLFPFYGMRVYPDTLLQQQMLAAGELKPGDDLLHPRYYLSPEFDESVLQQQLHGVKQRWVLPDEDQSDSISMLRAAGKRGPLWEYIL
ncbi:MULTISPECIES: lipid biosynthesis B12-binding/radical SAM protein [Ferrimonas]|uniref:lipid biosynthesis B12-binding/radical SAM protein n=1 Tax=Ferrimonas TaxID=44011 RepID=UPI000412D3B7|nr:MULTISPECIES: lipid biosynthesis B12-binding/radical SAM protein [Ferrimonas]USD39013.1 B12-binding domain-containing radical SAM protein [Ferrimonas sp. SCSIO 43195]